MTDISLRQTLRDVSFRDNESEQIAKGVARDLYNGEMPNVYKAAGRGETTYDFLPTTAQPTTAFSQEQLSKQMRELYLEQKLNVSLDNNWRLTVSWN